MIRAVLTDIEGTTSSLSFVKDVLFPYARARVDDFVRRAPAAHRPLVEDARRAVAASGTPAASDVQLAAALVRWIDEDRKITELKAIQGVIWEEGYRRGDLHGHVYPDAVQALRAWHEAGIRLYVYSSGSIHAQKLLFAHTEYGDLTPLFSGYFDTTSGGKKEADSYRRIVQAIGLPAGEIVFLSDIEAELAAAQHAGMQTRLLAREGQPARGTQHEVVRDLRSITF
jgi:enolase-phosphatase E1